ncbi:T9SS type A sorting domain-containing protein [Carboxylicivirga sp. N1Y90]|uniref:T9SS type A sorting domain-containing protein n=1 Tax=Carboxylicivirga fragile TaxID=3417571 RepID=UPI003D328B7D|nr:T9SS type A sorting domain-containing protein [Marinilabiliaceae bacterium N1Y90]
MKLSHVIILILTFTFNLLCNAQGHREFWFVAPEVSAGHGEAPVFFRITTFDEPTEVSISSPANPEFNTLTITIPANSQYTTPENAFDLDHLENRPSNTINNKGILISARDADISVYYEVASPVNPDKFTLKGKNALGTEFYIPSQNLYHNQRNLNPLGTEKVDIVATEDNTEVIIVSTENVIGHDAGETIQITLNRGQSYCLENLNLYHTSSLAGTHVTSDKPIAITISDDSINERMDYRGAYDLIGDQLIPTSVIGTEYVVVNTATLNNTITKVFVLATEDNTIIEINGDQMLTQMLSRGEQTVLDITPDNMHIESDKPIYVYQLASLRYSGTNEIGSAILPHIACTGSHTVGLKRIFNDNFFMQLLVKGKDRNNFSINNHLGQSFSYLDNINWIEVEGTNWGNINETWFTANIDLGNEIGTTNPYFVSNSTGLFHLSLLEENGSSASFGYFSSFGSYNIIEGTSNACVGDNVVLRAREPMRSYCWTSDLTGNTVLSTSQELAVTETATYLLTAELNFGGCELTNSFEVTFSQPEIDLGEDAVACPGESLIFGSDNTENNYIWSNGSTLNQTSVDVTVNHDQVLSVVVTDTEGCTNSDEVLITAFHVAEPSIITTQNPFSLELTNADEYERLEWWFEGNNIGSTATIQPSMAGSYHLKAFSSDGCETTKTVLVEDIALLAQENSTNKSLLVASLDANNNLIIKCDRSLIGYQLRLYDITGQISLKTSIVNTQTLISKSELKSGLFIIQATNGSKTYHLKTFMR